MHCLAGLDEANGGSIFIGGTDISKLNDDALTKMRREKVGFVFQSFNLVPTLTAEANILLPLALAGKKHDPAWLETIVSKKRWLNRGIIPR